MGVEKYQVLPMLARWILMK